MSDPITEARENLHAALLLIDESMDAPAAIEYAMEKADAYALAAHTDGCVDCGWEGSRSLCVRRARIGQGQSPGAAGS